MDGNYKISEKRISTLVSVPLDNFKSKVGKISLSENIEIITAVCPPRLSITHSEKLTQQEIREEVEQIVGLLRVFKRGPIGFKQILCNEVRNNLFLNHYTIYTAGDFKKYWPNLYEIKEVEIEKLRNFFSKFHNIKYGKNAFYFFQKAYREPHLVEIVLDFWIALESLYKKYNSKKEDYLCVKRNGKWKKCKRGDYAFVICRLYKTLKDNSDINVDINNYNNVMEWAYDMRCKFVHGNKVPIWKQDGSYPHLIKLEEYVRYALRYYLLNKRDYFSNNKYTIKIEQSEKQDRPYEVL